MSMSVKSSLESVRTEEIVSTSLVAMFADAPAAGLVITAKLVSNK